jgi:streptomycin 6-kinase
MSEDLNRYLSKWSLSEPALLATTSTSTLYRVKAGDRIAVLKCLTEFGRRFEALGAVALRSFKAHGAVELIRSDSGAHLLEYLEGPSLREKSLEGQDAAAAVIIAETTAKLHASTFSGPAKLPSLRETFEALFQVADKEPADSMYFEGAKVAVELLNSAINVGLLHGDIHHGNILHSPSRGWVAIDPQPLIGERTYDFALSFYNPNTLPGLAKDSARVKAYCEVFSRQFSVPAARILKFAFAQGCLNSAWQLQDGENPSNRLIVASLLRQALRELA